MNVDPQRRQFFAGLACLAALTMGADGAQGAAAHRSPARLLAATRRPGAPALRLLDPLDLQQAGAALVLPTRAHGMVLAPNGRVIVAARRPGEWLLRWQPGAPSAQWLWQADEERRFTGHLAISADGQRLYSSEIDADGSGRIVLRDPATLQALADWPSHGPDPHQLLLDSDGSLLVANGGLPSQSETGRMAWGSEAMDASLVRLDASNGALLGQWRLPDARLSPRHLAMGWLHGRRTIGVALQAEHADPARRLAAPVLAWFDGQSLRLAETPAQPQQPPLGGYSGDIAFAAGAWWLACPRAGALACWGEDGRVCTALALAGVCALQPAVDRGLLWAAGQDEAVMARLADAQARATAPAQTPTQTQAQIHTQHQALPPGWLLDNHWLALPAGFSSGDQEF